MSSPPQFEIVNADASLRRPKSRNGDSSFGGGEPPPHDGNMESRVAKLETIVPTLATRADVEVVRADLHKISSEMKGWFIATAVLVLVGMFTIANIMISQVRSLSASPDSAPSTSPVTIQLSTPPGFLIQGQPSQGGAQKESNGQKQQAP